MTLYQVQTGTITVEASSEEDLINKISAKLGRVSRHLGNGASLSECNVPWLKLAVAASGTVETDLSEPVVPATVAANEEAVKLYAEQAAEADAEQPVAEVAENG